MFNHLYRTLFVTAALTSTTAFALTTSALPSAPLGATPMDYPTQIDTNAPVVSRHEIFIAAPVEYAWAFLTDVEKWPQWLTGVTNVHIDKPLVPGQTFTWNPPGMSVASTVYDMQTPRRLLWGGPGNGIIGIHEWTFTEQNGGVLVKTEESFSGEPVSANVAAMQQQLDESLVGWLRLLKLESERAFALMSPR